jgi:hypothetical protein
MIHVMAYTNDTLQPTKSGLRVMSARNKGDTQMTESRDWCLDTRRRS